MRFMWMLVALPTLASAQSGPGVWDSVFRFAMDSSDIASGKSVFEVAKPDIIVQVSKHELSGADMIEIDAVKPNYPPALLASQVDKICAILGVPARGLRSGLADIGSNVTSTRATFATDGVIQRNKGILRVAPIVKAFAGAPEPFTVHGITILFNGEEPAPNVVRSYETPGLRLQAIALKSPPVVEYRVQLISQDPAALDVPDEGQPPEQNTGPVASTERRNGVDWSLWIPLGTAAVAAGVLVYFLMLHASTRPRR